MGLALFLAGLGLIASTIWSFAALIVSAYAVADMDTDRAGEQVQLLHSTL